MGSAGPIAMSLHATARWLGMEENALRETIRKTAIVSILIGLLIPSFLLNLGVAVKGRLSYLRQGFSPFRELLLCQQWTLFGYVIPFNFTMQFEVRAARWPHGGSARPRKRTRGQVGDPYCSTTNERLNSTYTPTARHCVIILNI